MAEPAAVAPARAIHPAFAGLENVGPLLLAVSGGPDSMALMHLAARWAASRSPALHVATVDHGLRPEAAREAAMVAAAAAGLGLPHVTLPWIGAKPTRRLQEKARAARYALLAAHAGEIGATHILTAHHADDQAETVLLRLGRGSGIAGLAGMRRLTPLALGITLARPLLETPKADLVAFCRAEAIAFADDPSNRDPAFARPRLRALAPALAGLGLDTPGLIRLARRMARADAALDAETERIERALRPVRGAGTCQVDLADARSLAPEIALRLLHRGLAHVAGAGQPIRLARLETLTEALWAALGAGRPHRATLAGVRISLDADGVLRLSREPPRRRGLARSGCPD